MASQYLLLINNVIVRDEQGNPIFEVHDRGKKIYTNSKKEEDLGERVQEVVNEILQMEEENELYEVVAEKTSMVRYNQTFRLKMFITPLYELQMQLASNKDFSRIAGTDLDVRYIWEGQMYEFYVREFLKYMLIIDHLEAIVRISRHSNSPFTIKNGDNRVMNILHMKVDGLFNPLDTIQGLGQTKLFRLIYGDGKHEDTFSLDAPAIFPVDIMRGAVTCFFATSSDIMKLCGIEHKEAISSRNIYRLIAGIVLKSTFGGNINASLDQAILSFPVSKTVYPVVDGQTKEVKRYFTEAQAAEDYAANNGYERQTLNTDASFIASAFASFRRRAITEETPLLHQIRGAEFVY